MKPTPILFLGDSPDLLTGLGRIGRDLAIRVASLPEFRVGFLGRSGCGSSQLPFHQYTFDERWNWGEQHIERIWRDFSRDEDGVLFTIWDPSRVHWIVDPRPEALGEPLTQFLRRQPFRRWGYFPVDATGPGDRLTHLSGFTVQHFHRRLAYTAWGAEIIARSIGQPTDWIPHGYNPVNFQPRDKTAGRMALGVSAVALLVSTSAPLVGCVMTNQARKDWGLACAAVAELRKRIPTLRFWVHIDAEIRYWNLYALLHDYGLRDCTVMTLSETKSDSELSYLYSACDLTILPSLGEGFGYPLVESLACGVPVIHGDYAGGAELLRGEADLLIKPVAYRLDGAFNCVRPVFEPADWADRMQTILDRREDWRERGPAMVEHLQWERLWPSAWRKWFLEGLI